MSRKLLTLSRILVICVLILAGLTGVSVTLAALLLEPPAGDLLLFALFMPASGGASLALGTLVVRLNSGMMGGIRGKILTGILLAAGLVFVNVGFTAYLMFLSPHDLQLLAVLLLFSMGVAGFFAVLIANSFQASMALLSDGVRRLGEGELESSIELKTGDELEELASAFNAMAQKLQVSAAAQHDLEEARRQLIAAVSHDLRTPLATMRAMVESIDDGVVTEPETIQRYHRTLLAEIGYLSRLIDDLFELSQIDSGLLELRPERSSISDLVSNTLEALRPQAEQKRLTLHGDIDGLLPAVLMDVPRMQRVLFNLVQNALRHTPPEGDVRIHAFDSGSDVSISVEDTGEGVDGDELPLIFERFYRGSRSRSRGDAGSGLGLTIAKGIVELHGGRIWAESERGQGSAFVFTVPKTTLG